MPGPALTPQEVGEDQSRALRLAGLLTPVRIVCLGIFLHVFDMSAAVMTLPELQSTGGFAGKAAVNVITFYYAAALVLMPLCGWLVEKFGARLIFVVACLMFASGAAISAASDAPLILGIGRAIQGMGGGLMVPVGRAAVLSVQGRDDILRAVAALSVPALIGPLVAPLIAGVLIDVAGWRALFATNAVLGLIIGGAAFFGVPDERQAATAPSRPFDLIGYGLLAAALLLFLVVSDLMMMQGQIRWAAAILLLLPCAVLGIMFRQHSLRHPAPVLDLTLFAHRCFALATWGGLLARLSLGAVPVLVTLSLAASSKTSAFITGVLLAVPTLGSLTVKGCIQPLARRTGMRTGILLGGSISALLIAALPLAASHSLWILAGTLAVLGFTRSAMLTLITSVAFQDVPPERLADSSAIASLAQQVSIMAGLHIAVALGSLGTNTALPGLSALHLCAVLIAVLSAVALLPLWRLPASRQCS